MMLDEFSTNQELQLGDGDQNDQDSRMNSNQAQLSELETRTHQDINLIVSSNQGSRSNNSTSSSASSSIGVDQKQLDYLQTIHHHQQQVRQQLNQSAHIQQQQQQHQNLQYFSPELSPSYTINGSKNFEPSSSSSHATSSSANLSTQIKQEPNQTNSIVDTMNVESTQLPSSMVPAAHCSDPHIHYSFPVNKSNTESSSTSMALNFSHDLLHQTSNHSQSMMQQHTDSSANSKSSQLTSSLDLGSGTLMQSAVGMNMWKNSMGLNHFKHPALADHNFLPNSDMNSFSGWSHANGLGPSHQASGMTHHILENQHLISYPSHQRTLPLSNQDLVGNSIKNQMPSNQATFMLNSINHQASTSQSSTSNHQSSTQPLDNLNLRTNHLSHSASYNLSMNDNQFYSSSRSEHRSHPNTIKSSMIITDRPVHISLNESHQNHLAYQSSEHNNLQPTTSHQHPGSSSDTTRNSGCFRCSTCNEMFTLRTAYQSHLKTHSHDKGE